MSKRLFALLAALMIASMALGACGPAPYECTDALGCVDIAPGEPIHIAYAMVIAGPDETLGIDSRTGAEVAVALKGQVLGHDVSLTGEDEG
jgi:branched-chain amino acid transport system substrate-binding protein